MRGLFVCFLGGGGRLCIQRNGFFAFFFFFGVYYIYFQKAMFEYEGESNQIESMHSFGKDTSRNLIRNADFSVRFELKATTNTLLFFLLFGGWGEGLERERGE